MRRREGLVLTLFGLNPSRPTGVEFCRAGRVEDLPAGDCGERYRRAYAGAFTLIELLVVMAIMMMIMGIGVAGWIGMRRGAEMRRSVTTVQTTLMLARQQAVTKRQTVTVQFIQVGQQTNAIWVIAGTNQVHSEMFLSPGTQYYNNVQPANITFKPNGSAAGAGKATVSLQEKAGQQGTQQRADIDVWLLTGTTRVTYP